MRHMVKAAFSGSAFTQKLSAKVEALDMHLGRGFSSATYHDASVPAFYGAGKSDAGFALVNAGLNDRFRSPSREHARRKQNDTAFRRLHYYR